MSEASQQFTIKQIAEAVGVSPQAIQKRSLKQNWLHTEETGRGGKRRLYALNNLPIEFQAALLKKHPPAPTKTEEPIEKNNGTFKYSRDGLWEWADRQSEGKREKGKRRANLLRQLIRLMDSGQTYTVAAELVAAANNEKTSNLRNWHYGVNKKAGARHYDMADWDAALIPGHRGRVAEADCDTKAWDWYKGYYLDRKQPTHANAYRRLEEVAKEQDWVIPSAKTLERWMEKKVPIATRVLKRQGEEALNRMSHQMKRDRTCFVAGEAVSGDGLKFDNLWVDWGDEIINTTTGWFWQDLYSNRLLAHRIAKTENTDLFRLATYDLTAITRPSYVQVDNTRVAANKQMTAGARIRYRFKTDEGDTPGILLRMGMDVHFTNPDHKMSNPGVKPIERAFGRGGIHEMVATNPKFTNRGFSKKTAIPVDEFRTVVAEEVRRYNAQKKRRSDVCRGLLSFDEAFNQSFEKATVVKPTEQQRRLLLLLHERVRANKQTGTITLKAGASSKGKNSYWNEALAEFLGHELVAYYDPEDLTKNISVYTLDLRFITEAEHKPSVAFNDTAAAREHAKFKTRIRKAQKKSAEDETRMDALERAALYPSLEDIDVPPPGVVQGNFGQRNQVDENMKLKIAVGHDVVDPDEEEFDANFSASIAQLRSKQEDVL